MTDRHDMSLIHSFIDLYRSLYNLDLLLIAVVVDFTTKGQICRKRAIHHMVYGASMMSCVNKSFVCYCTEHGIQIDCAS
jgi:hypothetical protein